MDCPARIKTIKDISPERLKNKRVLLRADFNVPLDSSFRVGDKEDWRIRVVLPTIRYLLQQGAKIIILAHLGRPKGRVAENLRLGPIQDKLSELLDVSVNRTLDCVGENVAKAVSEMQEGEILMLENLRFHKEEEENDGEFSKKLASLGDIYVNDAFSDSHRAHASIAGITKFIPSYAGLLLEKELKMMEKGVNPKRPAVAVIGGVKLETKLPIVEAFAKIYDYVLVGGMIANEILNTPIKNEIASNVILPQAANLEKQKYFDIGDGSVKEFAKFIEAAKFIVWNGPMGKFEDPDFEAGTKGIINAIRSAHKNGAEILIGGGETVYAVQKFAPELTDKEVNGFDRLTIGKFNISTGGGAMLEFLAGKKLPGIAALSK
jgi:3-phosphoglycerate kinase